MTASDRAPLSLPVTVKITELGETRTIEHCGERALKIGRADDNTIVLATSRASRFHAEIIGEGGRFTLIDHGSANGTIVDGESTRRAPLRAGSEIRIGEARIIFGEAAVRSSRAAPRRGGKRAGAGSARAPATTKSAASSNVASSNVASSNAASSSAASSSAASSSAPAPSDAKTARAESTPRPTETSDAITGSPPKIAATTAVPKKSPTSSPARPPAVAPDKIGAGEKVMMGVFTLIAIIGIGWALQELLVAPEEGPDRQQAALDSERSEDPETSNRNLDHSVPPSTIRGDSDRSLPTPPPSITVLPPDPDGDDGEPMTRRTPRRESAQPLEEWVLDGEVIGVTLDGEEPTDPRLDVDFTAPDTARGEANELPPPVLRIIADAWPAGSRTIGYEYNQKNHGSTPGFVGREGADIPERNSAAHGKKYRVIGLEISPADLEAGTQLRLRSAQIQGGEKLPLSIPEELPKRMRRYFALLEPEDRRVAIDLLTKDGRTVIASTEMILPEGGRTTPLAAEAISIMQERQREEWERSQLAMRDVTIEVFDDLGRPVPDATVLLLIEGGGMLSFEGSTDEFGRFRGAIVPGSYTVFVHADVPEPENPTERTDVKMLPRLLSLQGRLGAGENHLKFTPDRSVLVKILDEGESSLAIDGMWVTPSPIAEAYRYEQVATEVGMRGRLESDRRASGGLHLILGKHPVELGILGRTSDGEPVLITETVTPQKSELIWAFRRNRFAKIEFDPARGVGGVSAITGEIVAVSRFRERFPVRSEGPWRAYVMPGKYRITAAATLDGGETAQFLPYAVNLASGQTHDLTPRAPWDLTLYQKRKDRQQQLWLAVVDGGGRILSRPPGEPGRIRGLSGTDAKIDLELGRFAWQEAERLLGIDLGKLRFETTIPFGSAEIRGLAKLEQLRTFNAAGSSATAPGVFEDRILAILPEIKKTIDGSVETTGLPDGLRRIHLELDIFLPPGIGGTGGGGVITLDNAVMFRYACAGDPLPGAYRHEYGHNMGFGHDPYMMLAEGGSATDEKLFGELAFRLLHAETGARTIDYLLDERGARGFSWRPSPLVFPALRALYGPDVHKKMITERRASEQTLVLHGLSSIERIATLYSLALDRNVAWVFRAHGWPVFDARVDLGANARKFVRSQPRQLNYTHVAGTEITSWWVLDVDGGEDPLEWKRVVWPSANIDLAISGEPIQRNHRWLFFRRIVVAEDTDARVLCASDVGLEIRVNGQAIGVYDPSPQQFQPAHDELMLDQKRPLPVYLPKGENFIEVAVNQPPGSRGFVLALSTPGGKPLRLGVDNDPPPGEAASSADPIEVATLPVLGGSFEGSWRDAWIEGATDPQGSLKFTIDSKSPAIGKDSLRIDMLAPCSGAIIQRVFIPPGETYTLKAAMRSENFRGEAFVGLFTGELGGWLGRTEPLKRANQPWKGFTATWSPGASRVVYVACYVKGTGGRVWFDGVQLVPKK